MNLSLFRRANRLPFPIVRVDDRLVHGQVVVGWGQALQIRPLLVVSDRVAADPSLASTLRQLIPEEQQGDVVPLTEAAERWQSGAFQKTHAMLVVETPIDALKLVRLGAPLKTLVLGGLHFREGRDEFLPYIFLSDWDRTTLRELRTLGVKIHCQDLPTSKPVAYED